MFKCYCQEIERSINELIENYVYLNFYCDAYLKYKRVRFLRINKIKSNQ